MSNLIRHIIVRGRVQGVGYRAFVADEAMNRRLEGWVRNRRDGTVEAVFSGPADAVQGMVRTCRKGPLGSRVESVHEWEGSAQELALASNKGQFSILLSD
ncbi:MAG TPA: acylphosphatase [Pirellulaceae bacterium]|nr:acylphosphatase [Pirellulaceae bacterium]